MLNTTELKALMIEVGGIIKEHVQAAFSPLAKRIEALEARQPERGEKGDAGPVGERGPQGEAGPAGEKGADGAPGKSAYEIWKSLGNDGDEAAFIASLRGPAGERGEKGERGADGKSLTVDDILPLLKSMQAEWALDFERRAGDTLQRAIDRIPAPKDGKDGANGKDALGWDDMHVEYDGKRTINLVFEKGDRREVAEIKMPVVLDAGFWKDGMKAEQGDGVTFGGSYWIAQKDTETKPEIGNPDWRLSVKKGRDGKTGERGKDAGPREPLKVG